MSVFEVYVEQKRKGTKEKKVIPANTEAALWHQVGKLLVGMSIPADISIHGLGGEGSAYVEVKGRGTFTYKGVVYPSPHCNVSYNDIYFSESGDDEYKECYLTCINPESNNYKFYQIIPERRGNGEVADISAKYGRIGSDEHSQYATGGNFMGVRTLKNPYKPFEYWLIYWEKIAKGYKDETPIYMNGKPAADPDALSNVAKKVNATKEVKKVRAIKKIKTEDEDKVKDKDSKTSKSVRKTNSNSDSLKANIELYNLLIGYARGRAQQVYTQDTINRVTVEQARASRALLNRLGSYKKVETFNKHLMELMSICPRKVFRVSDALAKTTDDFGRIIVRETDLVQALEAIASSNHAATTVNVHSHSFKDYDISVFYATDEQKEQVLRHLSPSLQPLVKKVYRVIPDRQQEKFREYVEDNKIKTIKQFWHGSGNSNWASIVEKSLLLNPNARITGKMLGNGIYFAPSSAKSWNYTSYRGTTWASGNSDTAIMGVFATAFGNPLYVSNSSDIRQYTASEIKSLGKNCVYAKGGNYLRADELCFYSEAAMCLQYIVVFH